MKNINYIILILLLAFASAAQGQSEFYKRYLFNKLSTNPSYAGSADQFRLGLATRKQWGAIRATPSTDRIAFDFPFGKAAFKNMGVGVNLTSGKVGPEVTMSAYASYAYRFKIWQGVLSAGINAGLIHYKYDASGIMLFEQDPILFQTETTSTLNLNMGFNYQSDNLSVDASILNLTAPKIGFSESSATQIRQQILLASGYKIKMNESFGVKPSVTLKLQQEYTPYVDVNVDFSYKERYWLGAGYKLNYGAIFSAGMGISKYFDFGYAYDVAPKAIQGVTGGSHEIFLELKFGDKRSKNNKEIRLNAVDAEGNVIATTVQNKDGYFVFNELPASEVYMFSFDETDSTNLDSVNVKFANKEGKQQQIIARNTDEGYFQYGKLPVDEATLYMLNEQGDTLNIATKDKNGEFTFSFAKLPDNSSYLFKLKGSEDLDMIKDVKVSMVDENGNEATIVATKEKEDFFKYEMLPLDGTTLYMLNEQGDTVNIATKDKNGEFTFSFAKLPDNSSYLFKLNGSEDLDMIKDVKVSMVDENGNEATIVATKEKEDFFKYEILPLVGSKLYMLNEQGDTVNIATKNEQGVFTFLFSKLPEEEEYIFYLDAQEESGIPASVKTLFTDKEGNQVVLAASKETGQIFKYGRLPEENAKLLMIDEHGDTLKIAYRNKDGVFEFYFKNLPDDPSYIFKIQGAVDDSDLSDVMVLFTDTKGEESFIVADKSEEDVFEYHKLERKAMTLHMLDSSGDTLSSILINDDGFFVFNKLDNMEGNVFYLESTDSSNISAVKILFEGGNIENATINEDGSYKIEQSSKTEVVQNLSLIEEEEHVVELSDEQNQLLEEAFVSIEFELSSDQLTEKSKTGLKSLSDILQENETWRLKLGGHTDDVGSDGDNVILSRKRAVAVRDQLVTLGVPADKIIIKFFGEKYPIATNTTEEGRQRNRRVEMLLIKE